MKPDDQQTIPIREFAIRKIHNAPILAPFPTPLLVYSPESYHIQPPSDRRYRNTGSLPTGTAAPPHRNIHGNTGEVGASPVFPLVQFYGILDFRNDDWMIEVLR